MNSTGQHLVQKYDLQVAGILACRLPEVSGVLAPSTGVMSSSGIRIVCITTECAWLRGSEIAWRSRSKKLFLMYFFKAYRQIKLQFLRTFYWVWVCNLPSLPMWSPVLGVMRSNISLSEALRLFILSLAHPVRSVKEDVRNSIGPTGEMGFV